MRVTDSTMRGNAIQPGGTSLDDFTRINMAEVDTDGTQNYAHQR